MEFGEHWYDRLWSHLLSAAEVADEDKFNTLLEMREEFAYAEDKDEVAAARVLFENWEEINS